MPLSYLQIAYHLLYNIHTIPHNAVLNLELPRPPFPCEERDDMVEGARKSYLVFQHPLSRVVGASHHQQHLYRLSKRRRGRRK